MLLSYVEHYRILMDIIKCYLLPNSIALKYIEEVCVFIFVL